MKAAVIASILAYTSSTAWAIGDYVDAQTLTKDDWFTLSDNDDWYLDSNDSKIRVIQNTDFTAMDKANDKGLRYRFIEADGGKKLVCAAHNDHCIAEDTGGSGLSWRTDESCDKDTVVKIDIQDGGFTIKDKDGNYVSKKRPSDDRADWSTSPTVFKTKKIRAPDLRRRAVFEKEEM